VENRLLEDIRVGGLSKVEKKKEKKEKKIQYE